MAYISAWKTVIFFPSGSSASLSSQQCPWSENTVARACQILQFGSIGVTGYPWTGSHRGTELIYKTQSTPHHTHTQSRRLLKWFEFCICFFTKGKPNHHILYHTMHSICITLLRIGQSRVQTTFGENIHTMQSMENFKGKTCCVWLDHYSSTPGLNSTISLRFSL
jgi:hypothetical protein